MNPLELFNGAGATIWIERKMYGVPAEAEARREETSADKGTSRVLIRRGTTEAIVLPGQLSTAIEEVERWSTKHGRGSFSGILCNWLTRS